MIHAEQRIKAKKFSIYGVDIGSVKKMQEKNFSKVHRNKDSIFTPLIFFITEKDGL